MTARAAAAGSCSSRGPASRSGAARAAHSADGAPPVGPTPADGALDATASDVGPRRQRHAGTGPVADRQEGPHAVS